MSSRIHHLIALAALALGIAACRDATGPGAAARASSLRDGVPGEQAMLALDTPPDGVIRVDLWSPDPTYVHFTLRSEGGIHVCGRVALSFESDTAVATAVYSPLPDAPCVIRIVPLGPGRTTLTVSGPGMRASAEVEVTGPPYRWTLTREDGLGPEVPALTGSTLRYRVTAVDPRRRPVAGLQVRFHCWPGSVDPDGATTDSAGAAFVDWTLPAAGTSATLYANSADDSEVYAQVEQVLKPRYRWIFSTDAPQPVTVGSTIRYTATAVDYEGKPVSNLLVHISAPGTLNYTLAITDAAGAIPLVWTVPEKLRPASFEGGYWLYHGQMSLSLSARVTVSGTWPDGTGYSASDGVWLKPDQPAGFMFLMSVYVWVDGCTWVQVSGDVIRQPLPTRWWTIGMCESAGLIVGVVDRYGNPVRERTLPVVTADYPAALEGQQETGFDPSGSGPYVYRWFVMRYPLTTTSASPWAAEGLTLRVSLPGDPVPPRTVTVFPYGSSGPIPPQY